METLISFFNIRKTLWCLLLLAAIILPQYLGGYLTSMLMLICIWTILCFSVDLIYGYTGQLSLGQAAFFGIGAYAFGILTVKLQMGFWPAFLLAVIITGVFGLLIGIPALKLRGPYFILVTLGFSVIIYVVMVSWVELTGGANGLAGIPRPDPIRLPWGTLNFDSLLPMYYFILFFLVLIILFFQRLSVSLTGKIFRAISHNENLTTALGINTMAKKILSFTVSAVIAGIAGALYGSYNVVISPEIAYFARGMDAVAYLIVGGVGTIPGPIIGTFVLMAVPEFLQIVPSLLTLINGIILMLFLLFLPSGFSGGFMKIKNYFLKKVKSE